MWVLVLEIMQLYHLFVGLALYFATNSKLVHGIEEFEGSDFVTEHTLHTLLNRIDRGL